MTQTNNI